MADVAALFWAKVDRRDDNECWPWLASCDSSGYGHMGANGRLEKAHRLSYMLNVGPIPEGMHVLHRCDNRPCVNPAHLFVGTNADNVADRVAKGRGATGENNPSAKLTWEQVRSIRAEHAAGSGLRELGRKYGIDHTGVRKIVLNMIWKEAVT